MARRKLTSTGLSTQQARRISQNSPTDPHQYGSLDTAGSAHITELAQRSPPVRVSRHSTRHLPAHSAPLLRDAWARPGPAPWRQTPGSGRPPLSRPAVPLSDRSPSDFNGVWPGARQFPCHSSVVFSRVHCGSNSLKKNNLYVYTLSHGKPNYT